MNTNFASNLALVETPADAYREDDGATMARALKRLCSSVGWATEGKGPLGDLIPPGARVLIKPNFVLDHNQSNGGMDPMITHQSVVKAVVNAALQTDAAEVVVGDAPIQTCDFDALLETTGLGTWLNDAKALAVFAEGRTEAVFQFESSGMQEICRKLKPQEQTVPAQAPSQPALLKFPKLLRRATVYSH